MELTTLSMTRVLTSLEVNNSPLVIMHNNQETIFDKLSTINGCMKYHNCICYMIYYKCICIGFIHTPKSIALGNNHNLHISAISLVYKLLIVFQSIIISTYYSYSDINSSSP